MPTTYFDGKSPPLNQRYGVMVCASGGRFVLLQRQIASPETYKLILFVFLLPGVDQKQLTVIKSTGYLSTEAKQC